MVGSECICFSQDDGVVVLINITPGNPTSMDGFFPWKSTKSRGSTKQQVDFRLVFLVPDNDG